MGGNPRKQSAEECSALEGPDNPVGVGMVGWFFYPQVETCGYSQLAPRGATKLPSSLRRGPGGGRILVAQSSILRGLRFVLGSSGIRKGAQGPVRPALEKPQTSNARFALLATSLARLGDLQPLALGVGESQSNGESHLS